MDSVGIGEAPDSAQFDDFGVNTLGHIAQECDGLNMPNLAKLGLSNIEPILGSDVTDRPLGYYTKMQEASMGKDTMTGHWEIMGLYTDTLSGFSRTAFRKSLFNALKRRQAAM